jgi:plasmid stabilization system protein ParE
LKRCVYLDAARADLQSIADYYGAIDPEVADRILDDIRSAIAKLSHFPHRGRAVKDGPLRRVLSRRYRYKIAYRVRRDFIEIVGVFRFQDRQS